MILHTLSVSARHPAFSDCLLSAVQGDTILLLGDGVYAALRGSDASAQLQAHAAKIMVLDSDAAAAGLAGDKSSFPLIDIAGFVALSEYYPRQLAWY